MVSYMYFFSLKTESTVLFFMNIDLDMLHILEHCIVRQHNKLFWQIYYTGRTNKTRG